MDQALPKDIEYLARFMDDRFEIGGFRFGLNAVTLLLPEAGDLVTVVIAFYIYSLAAKYNLPPGVKFRMFMNVFIYFFIGLVPLFGDLFGVWWKPNRRNLRLLQNSLNGWGFDRG